MQIILGCNYAKGHIQPSELFNMFKEQPLLRNNPIPARSNCDCSERMTSSCTQDCRFSIYALLSGGKISYHNPGVTL